MDVLVELGMLIRCTPWLDWLLLTKRPENAEFMLREMDVLAAPNVWLGTSVENRDYLRRIAELCDVPAFRRFVSFEPLLRTWATRSATTCLSASTGRSGAGRAAARTRGGWSRRWARDGSPGAGRSRRAAGSVIG
jgi:protein gp37